MTISPDQAKKDFWRKAEFRPTPEILQAHFMARHRPMVVQAVLSFRPQSVLEFGCKDMPNLRLIAESDPRCRLTGVDISQSSIDVGRSLFPQGKAIVADEAYLEDCDMFDVIFTDALLSIYSEEWARYVLCRIVQHARLGVVFCEWHDPNLTSSQATNLAVPDHAGTPTREEICWTHNLRHMLNHAALTRIVEVKIPKSIWPETGWDTDGHIISAPAQYATE